MQISDLKTDGKIRDCKKKHFCAIINHSIVEGYGKVELKKAGAINDPQLSKEGMI